MRRRILFKNDRGNPIDAIVEVVPLQSLLVRYLEDDKMVRVDVDKIITWEDAPKESTLKDE
jgi:hypothetical protein